MNLNKQNNLGENQIQLSPMPMRNHNSKVVINARGYKYQILLQRLNQFPETSRLGRLKYFDQMEPDQLLQICDDYDLINKEFYFDRDPGLLANILNFNLPNKIHFGEKHCPIYLRNELDYWGIEEEHIDICCRYLFKSLESDMQVFFQSPPDSQVELAQKYKGKWLSELRMKLWYITEIPSSSWTAKVISFNYN